MITNAKNSRKGVCCLTCICDDCKKEEVVKTVSKMETVGEFK